MAFVQVGAAVSAVASGVAGASLSSVKATNGLICFVLYESVASSQTLTDSAGTVWALYVSLSLTGASIAVFAPILPLTAGTHTVTASFTGGGNAWTYLIEDTNSAFYNATTRKIVGPGSGNSLAPGAIIGVAGSPVYQLAVDNSHSTAGYEPVTGAFAASFFATNNDALVGAWMLVGADSIGGTNPGMAPGTSDPNGLDTYGILSVGLAPAGTIFVTSQQTILVEDPDTRWQKRFPYELVMGRGVLPLRNAPLSLLYPPRRPWELDQDRFAGVIPSLEVYSQKVSAYYSLPASAGIYTYTGQSATLTRAAHHSYVFICAPGNYNYDGGFSTAVDTLGGNTGLYTYQGGTALFPGVRNYVLFASAGAYAYSGGAASLTEFIPAPPGTLRGLILTTSTRTILGPKRVSQTVAPPFDFSTQTVANDVLTGPVVKVSVWSGVDANPGAVFGGALIQGSIVYVTLTAGVAGVIYQIEVTVQASLSGILTRDAFLAVLPPGL